LGVVERIRLEKSGPGRKPPEGRGGRDLKIGVGVETTISTSGLRGRRI